MGVPPASAGAEERARTPAVPVGRDARGPGSATPDVYGSATLTSVDDWIWQGEDNVALLRKQFGAGTVTARNHTVRDNRRKK